MTQFCWIKIKTGMWISVYLCLNIELTSLSSVYNEIYLFLLCFPKLLLVISETEMYLYPFLAWSILNASGK